MEPIRTLPTIGRKPKFKMVAIYFRAAKRFVVAVSENRALSTFQTQNKNKTQKSHERWLAIPLATSLAQSFIPEMRNAAKSSRIKRQGSTFFSRREGGEYPRVWKIAMTPEYKLDAARDRGGKNANKQLHRSSRIVMAFANLSAVRAAKNNEWTI